MASWTIQTLGAIADMVTDKVSVTSLTEETYISTDNMLPDRGGVEIASKLPPSGNVNEFLPGDILFSNIRTYFKKVWLAPKKGGASADVIVFRSKDPKKTHNQFLYYVLSSDAFIDSTVTASKGTKMPRGDKDAMKRFEIPLPPLTIQRRIAGILSAYDELIENSQRRIKILESMARALYREWFVHFRFPGHESVPRVPSPLGDIPQGWEMKKLGELMADHIGGGWGKETADEDHTQPAWVIRGTDIPSARSSQVTGVPHRFHTASNLRSRKLAAGDILFEVSGGSKGQPVGRTLLITPELLSALAGDVICATFCKRVRPKADAYGSEMLYLSFLEGYGSGEIEQYQVQSTGISNFKWTEYIANIDRVVPPAPLQSHFRELAAPLFTQIATVGLKIQNLRRTRDVLLPRLLSGQIDVEAMPS
jgi:type I restriction enzyme S subunit